MKRYICLFLLFTIVLSLCPVVSAEETPVEIFTVEDLQKMAENPAGSYILMADLDLSGIEWVPIDLVGGSFDGNGHSILNLSITTPGNTMDVSYDGNSKAYDTCFAGFFGVLREASVINLNLLNVRGNVNADKPCFLGSIAGAMYDSQISDCTVSGVLELQAFDRIFGLGGVVGYGSGCIERCLADVTLICIDTGKDTVDEQFLGGVFATGFIDVIGCTINIDGYVSEYGFVHSGGLIGMVMQKPLGTGRKGYLTDNSVTGKITFFECNTKRRAYCEPSVGETLASTYIRKNNTANFKRDERKDYSVILRPEMCENPVYEEVVTSPTCDSLGYTTYTCDGCGYSYIDHYTLPQHTVTQWTITQESTVEDYGISTGFCDGCGMEFTKEEPKLEPTEPETKPTQPLIPETEPVQQEPVEPQERQLDREIVLIPVILLILFIIGCVMRFWQARFE